MNKIKLTIADLFEIPTSVIYNPDSFKPVSSVVIDSRSVPFNSLFVAIEGEKYDGHDFVRAAVKSGASAVMINNKKYRRFKDLDIPFITVKDTTAGLGDLARIWRSKLRTKIIGITGSAGKTSTKEILAALLSDKFKVNRTKGNNNNHIGVPLTLLDTDNRYDYLVLELGTNHFGEIPYTAGIARPDFAMITNIGSSHLEFLKNRQGVFKEKSALFTETAARGGTLFINSDDDILAKAMPGYAKKISFGFSGKAEVRGKILGFDQDGKPVIEIAKRGKTIKGAIPLYGEQSAKNFLAAYAAALQTGMTGRQIYKSAAKFKAVDKRLNVKRFKDFVLIDDTYNANPESMRYAIELLGRIKAVRKKIAVLGDMFELGDHAEKLHKGLVTVLRKNKIDAVFTTGKFTKIINEALKNSKIEAKHFASRNKLEAFLRALDLNNTAVLVKGSRGMKMEEFVKVIEGRIND